MNNKRRECTAAVSQMIEPIYDTGRDPSYEEENYLAAFLSDELFGEYDFLQFEEVGEAVRRAIITVFPNYYPDGSHQLRVEWSENDYPELPNHPEQFKLSPTGKVKRISVRARR